MGFDECLNLLAEHPSSLCAENLFKICTFLTHAPQFKNDIILIQSSTWPIETAPPYLPRSINSILSKICDTSESSVDKLWELLRGSVWNYIKKTSEIDNRYNS